MQKEAPWTLGFLALLLRIYSVQCQGDWYQGRATFYGTNPGAGDTIMNGNCGYGYINKDEPVGWNIGALSDSTEAFKGACGRCYEVRCDPVVIYDAHGQSLDRTGACFDPQSSVVIRITDACPCNYPNNPESNRRWCCGDTMHIDLSVYAYQKLADLQWGAIGIQYREVPCYYTPSKQAYLPSGRSPFPDDYTNKPSQLPNRGYDWTSLKATWVQVEAKGSQHQVISSGALQSAWGVVGQRVNVTGVPSAQEFAPVQGARTSAPAACFRLPPHNGTVIFVSEINQTFSNITGMVLSVRRGQHGVLPEMELLLGRFTASKARGAKASFQACPQDLPLRTLVPAARKGAKVPAVSLLQQRKEKKDPSGSDMLPELPPAPQVGVGPEESVSELPESPETAPLSVDDEAKYVIALGGRLDNVCQSNSNPRDRIFTGCGKLSAEELNAIMLRNGLPVAQDVCLYDLELAPAEARRPDSQ